MHTCVFVSHREQYQFASLESPVHDKKVYHTCVILLVGVELVISLAVHNHISIPVNPIGCILPSLSHSQSSR